MYRRGSRQWANRAHLLEVTLPPRSFQGESFVDRQRPAGKLAECEIDRFTFGSQPVAPHDGSDQFLVNVDICAAHGHILHIVTRRGVCVRLTCGDGSLSAILLVVMRGRQPEWVAFFYEERVTTRDDIRNVAIIAHVDHGKTTLVDAMLKQSNIFRQNEQVGSLILDSNALEREKGITILAKNTAIRYHGVKINIIDTPGHADFGGEVERVLNMADGCLLLVDAAEGPMPQTRFVLKKALELGLRPVVVINKVDRPNARIADVLQQTQDLFLDLATDPDQLDFPVLYTVAKDGIAMADLSQPQTDLHLLFDTILHTVPAPSVAEGSFQMLVTTLGYDSYQGRIAIGRIFRGAVALGDAVTVIGRHGTPRASKVAGVFSFEGLKRLAVDRAEA